MEPPKRDDVQPRRQPEERQTLPFLFTPKAPPREELRRKNPLAKSTTYLPEEVEALRQALGEAIGEVVEYANEQTVYVDAGQIVEALRFLKEERGFTYLSDLGTIDRFTEEGRFEVFYNVVNIEGRKRLRLKVRVEENEAVPTATGVFPSAMWHEREGWDLMGVPFEGLQDPRRMFMPEDFAYHPLRKEFPTIGIPGSLPLPPQSSDGGLTLDPFARAHGHVPKD